MGRSEGENFIRGWSQAPGARSGAPRHVICCIFFMYENVVKICFTHFWSKKYFLTPHLGENRRKNGKIVKYGANIDKLKYNPTPLRKVNTRPITTKNKSNKQLNQPLTINIKT